MDDQGAVRHSRDSSLVVRLFFAGAIPHFSLATLQLNLHAAFPPGQDFFTMFALFFPAVTGIMAGVTMSGDLRNPSKSLPLGTFLAIAFTTLVYLAVGLLLAGAILFASPHRVAIVHVTGQDLAEAENATRRSLGE